jgi:hypothetical protein
MRKKGTRNLFNFAFTLSPSGVEVRTRFEYDGENLIVSAGMFRNGHRITENGQHEILRGWLPFFTALSIQHFAPILTKDLAQAEKLAAEMAKWIDQYDSVDLGKKDSPEKLEALRFLKNWHRERLFAQAVGETLPDADQIGLLRRLTDALDTLDHKFLEALPKVARILSRRRLLGHAERDNRLLAYKLRYGFAGTKLRTPEEIQKLLRLAGSVKTFHDRLHDLAIDHKAQPRGLASPNYRFKKKWTELKANFMDESARTIPKHFFHRPKNQGKFKRG